MSTEHDEMECLLRASLKQAADRAPRGPSPQAIMDQLAFRQRRRRHLNRVAAIAAAVALAALIWLQINATREPTRRVAPFIAAVTPAPGSHAAPPLPALPAHRAEATLAALLDIVWSSNAADMDWSTSLNLRFANAEMEPDWTYYNLRLAGGG